MQSQATGRLIEVAGQRWYRIEHLEGMEPFLTTVVSDSDLWLFVSSAGPLTAGRVDADRALLPYETDDRLHRAVGISGPVTILARGEGAQRELWRPFSRRAEPGCRRALEKHELGTSLTFEEVNDTWGLQLRMTWEPSGAYGWVRRVELTDLAGAGVEVEVLDGLLDVMPAGVDAETERKASNLVDAYKRCETGPWGTAAIYALESRITDRAEPSEALAATLVWSTGLDGAEVHLDEGALDDAIEGVARTPTSLLTGRRGAYLLRGRATVPAGGATGWLLVADTGLGHAALHDRLLVAGDPDAAALVRADVAAGADHLDGLLTAADARQRTADPVADVHHLSNVLFNSMRGGIFVDGYVLDTGDVSRFLAERNREVQQRHAAAISALGPTTDRATLLRLAEDSGDADLLRLALEYLPLAFSRRHGDPSRPWNRFSIRVTDEEGNPLLRYEGNWRDIFQNWEALLRSYPRYLSGVVATFVNASTADGHNPYRIAREGVDWEVPDPEDPWSNIGYWGDHQIVYLLRLLEAWEAAEPGALASWLDRAVFTYADVPYRIAGYAQLLADPRDTITFDAQRNAEVADRVDRIGADGKLLVAGGALVRATMAEKLLVPALAKLSSYVAGGGIWMHTQRPEWNDANNALAGYGLSMVTLYQLERYLSFLQQHLVEARDAPVVLSQPVRTWLQDITAALASTDPQVALSDATARRGLLDALGTAAAAHRDHLDAGFDTTTAAVELAEIDELLTAARAHLDATIRASRRDDGLYHAYNLVSFPDGQTAVVEHLPAMLEGQVAVLGTTALTAEQVADLVDALFDSALYRPDQHSFLLYPIPERPSFRERNSISAEVVADHPVLEELVQGRAGILQRDASGGLHFRADVTNAAELAAAMAQAGWSEAEQAEVQQVYEELCNHHAFTGRSGGMHGYEGIGSIYWHMVAKLLLAVQERTIEVEVADAYEADAHEADAHETDAHETPAPEVDAAVHARLTQAYRRLRDGLGFRKDPATYGAFPTDCYSHTPAHAGAQQPGMTGQVKEEVLSRAGELGLRLVEGRLCLGAPLLPADELWADLGDGHRGFEATFCATPIRVSPARANEVRITRTDGSVERRTGRCLTVEETAAILDRDGVIARLEFAIAEDG